MPRARLTQQQAEDRVTARGYTLISKYTAARDKHLFKCSKGHTWDATYSNVVSAGNGCRVCKEHSRRTPEATVHTKIAEVHGNKVKLITPYTYCNGPSTFKCTCGHEWVASTYNVISRRSGCPKCAHQVPDVIYFYHLIDNIYKVGVTSSYRKLARINEVAAAHNVSNPDILVYRETKDARLIEKVILDCYANLKTSMVGEGYTEMLELTEGQAIELVSLLEII